MKINVRGNKPLPQSDHLSVWGEHPRVCVLAWEWGLLAAVPFFLTLSCCVSDSLSPSPVIRIQAVQRSPWQVYPVQTCGFWSVGMLSFQSVSH